ncbi:hypothetical protein [Arvimicrobium flavum]|uniref:hypothetical protein n=1 Tax=Arvimicrobium flavum TaxID=3393320 RepID=UPI00237A9005|nr:hypothetical protein [Mesorhizobium shangrilense]
MNRYIDIWNDVLRIVTLQPHRSYRDTPRSGNGLDDLPTKFRYERRGGERRYG